MAKNREKQKKKIITSDILAWLMSGLFGILSGLFLVLGYQLEKLDHIDLTDKSSMLIMLSIMIVLAVDTRHIWKNYDLALGGKKLLGLINIKSKALSYGGERLVLTRSFLAAWGILVLLNIPVLLAEYPGFFVYDAQEELNEVLTRSFSTHHPLLHVLLLGGTIAFVHKLTGSWNAGIFVYIFIQMLVITAIFAYVCLYMEKKGIGRKNKIICAVYYGIFPTIAMYTLCSSKDGLFSALLLLLIVYLIQLVDDSRTFLMDKKKCVMFVLTAALMPCFRHNGFYAYLVFVPFALWYFRKELKSFFVFILAFPVALYILLSGFLTLVLGAETSGHQEMLTVPIMQMTRVYACERDEMTESDIEALKTYIPEENLKMYTPRVSDLVKIGFDNEAYENDKQGFWRLWAGLFSKHPMTYVNAWLLTSYGYWYPPALINVYKGMTVFTFTYEDSSYFGYEVEAPGERMSLIPAIDRFYRYISIGTFHKDAPVIALIFAPGTLIIVYIFVLFYRISKKSFGGVLPFVPLILVWLTVLLGPTYLVRYVLILWTALPLLAVTGTGAKPGAV